LERTAVGLLRITARLLRREELATEVLSLMRMLLLFKKKSIYKKLSRQISFGIHDLLRTNAANINSNDDWSTIFTILQVYGAGATSPFLLMQNYQFSRSLSLSKSSNFLETSSYFLFNSIFSVYFDLI
jgi:brefeldin A-resistance guanine nucleotide exchange factor 1